MNAQARELLAEWIDVAFSVCHCQGDIDPCPPHWAECLEYADDALDALAARGIEATRTTGRSTE